MRLIFLHGDNIADFISRATGIDYSRKAVDITARFCVDDNPDRYDSSSNVTWGWILEFRNTPGLWE